MQSRVSRLHAPLLLAVGFALLTLPLLVISAQNRQALDPAWAVLILLGYLVVLHPRAELRLEVRRQAFCLSLAELPLVFGIVVLPVWYVAVAGAVAWLAVSIAQRGNVERAVFNASVTALMVGAAGVLFTTLSSGTVARPMVWVAMYVATLTAAFISAIAVVLVIAAVQGRPNRRQIVSLISICLIGCLLNTTFALIVLLVLRVQIWAAVLVVAFGTVLVFAYRGYSKSVAERKNMSELYDFTKAVGSAQDRDHEEGRLAEVVLEQTRAFLRAEQASLWLPERDGFPGLLMTVSLDGGVQTWPVDEADDTRIRVMAERRTLVQTVPSADDRTEERTARISTPLYSGDVPVGVLEVRDRLGEKATFSGDDAQLLQALSAHSGVAVQNSRLVRQLRHDATHDSLTGLMNRSSFIGAVEQALLAEPASPGEIVAVLLLDLDSFKDVNDTLGHTAGDRLLLEVSRRLSVGAPAGAVVARMGGDEFAVLLRLPNAEVALQRGITLQENLLAPVELDELAVDAGGSVGVAVYPEHAQDAVTLLQRAEVAMYAAKDALRPVQSYLSTMDSLSVRRLSLVSELRRAIDDGQLTVFYQPKVQLRDQEMVGVEALVRWQHPVQGIIPPDDFVPIAEHTGMIGPLTAFVLESALRQCRDWQDRGRRLQVSVNVSVRSLLDPDFADQVSRLISDARVDPSMLTLEITESGVMSDVDRAMPTLDRLKQAGVRMSVDDFGTGHSSLTYLHRLPVSEVKIDKSFVLNMSTDPNNAAIVRTIIDLGRNLDLRVVAEGVENELSYSMLREMGCNEVQGYLLSRPLPYEQLEKWIQVRTEMTPNLSGVKRLRVVGG